MVAWYFDNMVSLYLVTVIAWYNANMITCYQTTVVFERNSCNVLFIKKIVGISVEIFRSYFTLQFTWQWFLTAWILWTFRQDPPTEIFQSFMFGELCSSCLLFHIWLLDISIIEATKSNNNVTSWNHVFESCLPHNKLIYWMAV